MTFDPSAAHVIVGIQRYQVLKPQQFSEVLVGVDPETGEPVTERVPLPREWDEEATMALVDRDHPRKETKSEVETGFQDVAVPPNWHSLEQAPDIDA